MPPISDAPPESRPCGRRTRKKIRRPMSKGRTDPFPHISNQAADGSYFVTLWATYTPPPDPENPSASVPISGFFQMKLPTGDVSLMQLPANIDAKIINSHGILAGTACQPVSDFSTNTGSDTQQTQNSPPAAILLPVQIKRVWSDQLPGVEANYLADAKYNGFDSVGTGNDDKKYIFIGAAQSNNFDGKGHIKAQIVTSATGQLLSNILWRLAKDDGSGNLTIAPGGSSYTAYDGTSQVVSVTIDNPEDDDTSSDYFLVGGYDSDGDGQLSASEANITPQCLYHGQRLPYSVKIVSSNCYNSKLQSITNWASNSASVSPHASELLMAFATQTVPSSASSSGNTTVDRLEPGLDHSVGILFDASNCSNKGLPKAGPGTSIMANFDQTTRMSKDVANSVTMNNWLQDQLSLPASDNAVRQYFAQNPDVITGTLSLPVNGGMDFQPGSSSGGGDIDLFLAFGKVNVNVTAVVTVDRSLAVIEIKLTGDMTDLYDFNFDSDAAIPFVKDAANVQAGYNTLGIGGRVYKSTVHMQDTVLDDFQFHFP